MSVILQNDSYCKGQGRPKKGTPTRFRHTFGVRATLRKVPIAVIKGWMGHASVNSTQIYTDVVAEDTKELFESVWVEKRKES